MSQDQSLSTEDLAGRQRPSDGAPSEPPQGVAAGATEPDQPRSQSPGLPNGQSPPDDGGVSLVDSAQAESYRARWGEVQVRFVDDPQGAVGDADALVAEAMQSLASAFADHKSRLETQWQGGGDADTEELRLALRRYRSFFNRLLET